MNIFKKLLITALALTALLLAQLSHAHCELPCGIYDDHAEVQALLLDVTTIEKSLDEINALAGKTDAQSENQMVRWVVNKDAHAQNIVDVISNYFLTQRVKPSQPDYVERLARHHAVILAAVKVKQSADPANAKTLEQAVETIAVYYPNPNQDHDHSHSHGNDHDHSHDHDHGHSH